jgi:hypothetical protein
MKRIVLGVAALTLASAASIFAAAPRTAQITNRHPQVYAMQEQAQAPADLKTFTGTIAKTGDLFVLRDESSKSAYQLDDQESAGKFAGKRVRVIGFLDDSSNTIRIQSIEVANA